MDEDEHDDRPRQIAKTIGMMQDQQHGNLLSASELGHQRHQILVPARGQILICALTLPLLVFYETGRIAICGVVIIICALGMGEFVVFAD